MIRWNVHRNINVVAVYTWIYGMDIGIDILVDYYWYFASNSNLI